MPEVPLEPSPAVAPSSPDNASSWFNFTMWTVHHIPYLNMTKLAPSIEDLVLAGPRIVRKLGSVFSHSDRLDDLGADAASDSIRAQALFASTSTTTTNTAVRVATDAVAAQAEAAESILSNEFDPSATTGMASSKFSFEGARGFGSVFSYATSKWALLCIAMALVLNRTHIFAATRRRLRLRWPVRLALRLLPILMFLVQARSLLQSIQCQTSPDFAQLRWGDPNKSSELMFSQPNSLLHHASSSLLFGATDRQSCLAVRMIPDPRLPADQRSSQLRGSLSRLWLLFGTFCISQFIETFSCAVQGRAMAAETGMTLFEHSLAFAEADAAISNQLGWGLFATSGGAGAASTAATTAAANVNNASIAITRAMILRRANTPPEVLLVAFLSAMSHVTSHILGVFNLQSRARLVSTGFYAMCFMASIIWSGVTFSLEDPAGQGLLRFPTVCIIGYIPHVLVLGGIGVCCSIYALALLLTALSPPEVPTTNHGADIDDDFEDQNLSLVGRLRRAHDNMQANMSLSDVRITMEMDFYTALLRAGFAAISMASEAVYLNEDRRVNLARRTWLEDDRIREMEQLRMQWLPGSRYDSNGAIGLVPVVQAQTGGSVARHASISGYSRERAAQKLAKTKTGERVRPIRDGVGAAERSGRWLLAVEFTTRITRLIVTWVAMMWCKGLARVGFTNPPAFLRYLAQQKKPSVADGVESGHEVGLDGSRVDGARDSRGQIVGEWIKGQTGMAYIPRQDSVDLEQIVSGQLPMEEDKSEVLYSWWLRGGWWGEVDKSDDYTLPMDEDADFDTTSVISTTETDLTSDVHSQFGDEWESDEDDGQRTPTQRSPLATRESSPVLDSPLAMSDLARLLHPRSPEEHDEARVLASHLGAEGIVTRSRYTRLAAQQRIRVLREQGFHGRQLLQQKMTADEEAQLLEQILLSRREGISHNGETWATGAPGLGPEGPQCVVCHSASRTIIVWPCRCLSLCDDCRVSLAMNNFDKCVCCRREVISFSRIYVP